MDEAAFLGYVEQVLLPALLPGDVVAMNNLSTHKTDAVKGVFSAAGRRLLYLPPYSPDYNPIENMWSKIKDYLCFIAARELTALYDAIATSFSRVTQEDCNAFFKHCGEAI